MTNLQEALPEGVAKYLAPTYFVNSDSAEVQQFVAQALRELSPDAPQTEKAIRLSKRCGMASATTPIPSL